MSTMRFHNQSKKIDEKKGHCSEIYHIVFLTNDLKSHKAIITFYKIIYIFTCMLRLGHRTGLKKNWN